MATDTLPLPTIGSAARQIELRGVRVHNLKNIDLDIPLGCLVAISGVSGSGKSSLAFDALFAEGQRRYLETFSLSARQHLDRIERPNADRIAHVPVTVAIRSEQGKRAGHDARSTVGTTGELLDGIRLLFARVGKITCPNCERAISAHSTADAVRLIEGLPTGTKCQLGFVATAGDDVDLTRTLLARGFSRAIWKGKTHDLAADQAAPPRADLWIVVDRIVAGKAAPNRIIESVETALREGQGRFWILIETSGPSSPPTNHVVIDARTWERRQFSRSLECLDCRRTFLPLEPRLFSHMSAGACLACRGTGLQSNDDSTVTVCMACEGTRFRDEARAVRVAGHTIGDFGPLSPTQTRSVIDRLSDSLTPDERSQTQLIVDDVRQRVAAATELGLDHLTLDRSADSLSGGEFRRLLLAAVIGSKITGTLVIVDEPSAGLSVAEMPSIVTALRRIQSRRNSVVVVEHAPTIVAAADHVIELGPGAGPAGGHIVYQGHAHVVQVPMSSAPRRTRKASGDSKAWLRLAHIRHHNLCEASIEIPENQLCVITGPSGAGKTSFIQLLHDVVARSLSLSTAFAVADDCHVSGGEGLVDVVLVDQSPLTTSARSNPATWLDVFDEIRQTFSMTAEAKQRGFTAQQFSFNSAQGGRCRGCLGTGLLKHDMQFLPDISLTCPQCSGTRYRPEILEVRYRGRSIADVLAMSISEAASFFRSQPRIQPKFQLLKQIGLDYLTLGQPCETLSGGESQRLKLAARLTTPNRGPSLILCDEPTNGLHPADVPALVACFRELLANGHSLVLADNSPELLSAADYVIQLPLEQN